MNLKQPISSIKINFKEHAFDQHSQQVGNIISIKLFTYSFYTDIKCYELYRISFPQIHMLKP